MNLFTAVIPGLAEKFGCPYTNNELMPSSSEEVEFKKNEFSILNFGIESHSQINLVLENEHCFAKSV